MRNIIIARITEILVQFPDLQLYMDISPDELQSLSNQELADLLEEAVLELHEQQGD
jgi:hypothetical protein